MFYIVRVKHVHTYTCTLYILKQYLSTILRIKLLYLSLSSKSFMTHMNTAIQWQKEALWIDFFFLLIWGIFTVRYSDKRKLYAARFSLNNDCTNQNVHVHTLYEPKVSYLGSKKFSREKAERKTYFLHLLRNSFHRELCFLLSLDDSIEMEFLLLTSLWTWKYPWMLERRL